MRRNVENVKRNNVTECHKGDRGGSKISQKSVTYYSNGHLYKFDDKNFFLLIFGSFDKIVE